MPKATCCDVRTWVTAPISSAPGGITAPYPHTPLGPAVQQGPGRAERSGRHFPGGRFPLAAPGRAAPALRGPSPKAVPSLPAAACGGSGLVPTPAPSPPGCWGPCHREKGAAFPASFLTHQHHHPHFLLAPVSPVALPHAHTKQAPVASTWPCGCTPGWGLAPASRKGLRSWEAFPI